MLSTPRLDSPTGKRPSVLLLIGPLLLALISPGTALAKDDEKAGPDGKEIKKLVTRAIRAGDESGLVDLMRKLGRTRGTTATRALLDSGKKLAKSKEDEGLYWIILSGVAGFRHGDAWTEIGKFVVENRENMLSRDFLNIIQQQKNKHKYYNRLIRRVLKWCPEDLQLMSVDLAAQVPVRRTVDILMAKLEQVENDDKASGDLKRRLISALEALTKQRFGDSFPNWDGWWKANRHKGLAVLRMEADDEEALTGVVQPLDPIRAREFHPEAIPPGKVLVIKCGLAKNGNDVNFDAIQEVLSRLQVEHTVIEKDRVPSFDIDEYRAIFINCNQINPFCQSPGHQGGDAVGNRLRQCLGPAPHDQAHFGWFCGDNSCNINGCSRAHPTITKLKKWVGNGGYLFTEDWVLVELVEPAWPDLVQVGPQVKEGNDWHVGIRPAKGQGSHPLLRGVFVPPLDLDDYDFYGEDEEDVEDAENEFKEGYDPAIEDDPLDEEEGDGHTGVDPEASPEDEEIEEPEIEIVKHTWKIDHESHVLKIKKKRQVTTLISSRDMKKVSGQKEVAITFQYKRGHVLHVMSHFGKQDSVMDEATIENLMINWLMQINIFVE